MRLENHIVSRFLTDGNIALQMVEAFYPNEYRNWRNNISNEGFSKIQTLYTLLNSVGQKSFVITETVINNLTFLKIDKPNWRYLEKIPMGKVTLILPANQFLRVRKSDDFIEFCYCKGEKRDDGETYLNYTAFYINLETTEEICPNGKGVHEGDKLLIFKILCFMYLTDNTEEIVAPGKIYGTKKLGKISNDFKFPVTVVTSKWNITSIRTEGFGVRGHFRVQPCGKGRTNYEIIFIEPFTKKGYVRRSGKQIETETI